ncbi:hypothetical protein SAMN05444280_12525 [Tangfeifania diversioriginum]|uniref:Uncharacterized protein n=1 Tax=Tangfeifania diversioriginum TaxID=1168035 RepID=A0A1M6L0M6_9BACT|nr:hypothetical protein SAMN05444280_12525 [Tangfeifania diversioriginum]
MFFVTNCEVQSLVLLTETTENNLIRHETN